ncbi:hypothetical protein GMMP1_1240003 [Candidatus Magnetomoraceae bacterium gMMP-1]
MYLNLQNIIIRLIITVFMIYPIYTDAQDCPDIVVFMDNSGSIRNYGSIFRNQIRQTFSMAEENNKLLNFMSIGDKQKFQHIKTTREAVNFDFNDKTTFINFAFTETERRKIICSKTDTIIIVSDMQPDQTNTRGNFLAQDYQDLLDYYDTLTKWISMGKQIHIILLKVSRLPSFERHELDRQNLRNEIKDLILHAGNHEAYLREMKKNDPSGDYGNLFIRSPRTNRKLVMKVLESLNLVSAKKNHQKSSYNCYPLPLRERATFLAIFEGIIDPSIIDTLYAKIEIEREIIDFDHRTNDEFKTYLQNILPGSVGTNPLRHIEYTIVNGDREDHDNNYHYHFHVWIGETDNRTEIFLTNKHITNKRTVKIAPQDSTRSIDNKKYTDIDHFFSILLKEIKKIAEYQVIDFPVGRKKIFFCLKPKGNQNLIGYYFGVDVKNDDEDTCGGTFENNGCFGCYLNVRRQGNSKVALLFDNSLSAINPTTKEFILRNISDTDVLHTELIEIPVSSSLLSKVTFSIDENLDQAPEITILQRDLSKQMNIESFYLKGNKNSIDLIPGDYFYNLRLNSDKYLNIWFKPITIYENNSNRSINIPMKKDEMAKINSAFSYFQKELQQIKTFKSPYDLTSGFKDHIMGSSFFLLHLLEFTDKIFKNDEQSIKDLWERIRHFLFYGKKSNYIDAFLFQAYKKIGFINPYDEYDPNNPVKNAKNYLHVMMDYFIDGNTNQRLENRERQIYNDQILVSPKLKKIISPELIKKFQYNY